MIGAQVVNEPNEYIVRSESAAKQAETLSASIADHLSSAIAERGVASVAFSGGSTPVHMLQQLATESLDWSRVVVTLVDERCVDEANERSNARLVRTNFLDRLTEKPQFVPLFIPAETAAERNARLSQVHRPFDVVHLGMGTDAHTASFFPDASNIDELLDLQHPYAWQHVQSVSSVETRLTWSLAALLQTRYFALQLIGGEKWRVFADALSHVERGRLTAEERRALPVAAYLAETQLADPDGIAGQIYFCE